MRMCNMGRGHARDPDGLRPADKRKAVVDDLWRSERLQPAVEVLGRKAAILG